MKKNKELFFYITVCMGTALSSSSFTVMSGMFETINGIWVLISTILAGIFCIAIADSIAELASRYPSAPGVRTYLKNAFNPKTSLFFAYLYMLFILIIGSVESCMFSLVVKQLFPTINGSLIIILMLVSVVAFNLIGLELPRNIQMLTTSIVVIALLSLGLAGIYKGHGNMSNLVHEIEDMNQFKWIPLTLGMAIFLFVGFEWVTPLGYSSQSYQRKIPLSMPLGILFNIIVYVIFLTGLCLVVPKAQLSENVFPHVKYALSLFGSAGVWFAAILSSLAIISTFNSGIMGGSRLLYALGREGKLPKFVTKISLSQGVPYVSIIMLGVFVGIVSLFVNAYDIVLVSAAVGSSIICFLYAALMAGSIIINAKGARKQAGYSSMLPEKLKLPFIVILFVIGILSLFSIPGQSNLSITIFLIVIIVAFTLSMIYTHNAPAVKKLENTM